MNKLHLIFLILLSFLITSCSLEPVGPVPTDHFYRLPEPTTILQKRVFDGDIFVRNFRSNGLHTERAILFSEDELGLVLEQHHYHFWQDTPQRMLQTQLISWLRAMDAAPFVMTDPSIAHDYVITSRIKRFERQIKKEASAIVIVAIEMQLQKRGTDQLLLASDYAAEVEVGVGTVQGSIPAYAEALESIFTAFLADAEQALSQD